LRESRIARISKSFCPMGQISPPRRTVRYLLFKPRCVSVAM
jgi:hypothetical protein